MASKIPVTVITGFLGSGKTTLIRHLLEHNQGWRMAVLVNEFGELGIDGDLLRSCQTCPPATQIIELANGCLCCTVQEEFLPTLVELLQRRHQLDQILIETSGLALPKPLLQAFRWPEIRHGATVDGVVTVVDCQALDQGASQPGEILAHGTPLEELFADQLACADLVVLNKTDQLDTPSLDRVRAQVSVELPREVKIITCTHGQVDPRVLLGLGAQVEDHLEQRPSHHDNLEDHDHDPEVNAAQVVIAGGFDPADLEKRLVKLLKTQEIYRVKGFVAVPQKPMRLVFQGVGRRFDYFYDRPWEPAEARKTRLVFIGKDLEPTQIAAVLGEGV